MGRPVMSLLATTETPSVQDAGLGLSAPATRRDHDQRYQRTQPESPHGIAPGRRHGCAHFPRSEVTMVIAGNKGVISS